MNILLLGGTGAIGKSLIPLLVEDPDIIVFVTSRLGGQKSNNPRIRYFKCNAMEDDQLREVLGLNTYDVIIDFMNYHTEEFRRRYELLLSSSEHYVFLSSCRVFADQPLITESSISFLDALPQDSPYLKKDTYTLAKARCERILRNSLYSNYTIVRPYITYNTNRFQLGIYEKEHFLYRALKGRPIVISKDILSKKTSMTSSWDVAMLIRQIIFQEPSGKNYNLVSTEMLTWGDILYVYVQFISDNLGGKIDVTITEDSNKESSLIYSEEKYKYDRLYDRTFQNIEPLSNQYSFIKVEEGLRASLSSFFQKPTFGAINWNLEAYLDKESKRLASKKEFPSFKSYVHYLLNRYTLHKQ